MKKSYLISIQPQWLEKILNGQKTIEVRRKVNKDVLEKLDRGETVEAYLYCTKGKPYLYYGDLSQQYEIDNYKNKWGDELNATIPAKIVIDGYDEVLTQHHIDGEQIDRVLKYACIEREDFDKYIGDKEMAYALHISKVEILDEVMKLDDFYCRIDGLDDNGGFKLDSLKDGEHVSIPQLKKKYLVSRPPQNMMSVWVK